MNKLRGERKKASYYCIGSRGGFLEKGGGDLRKIGTGYGRTSGSFAIGVGVRCGKRSEVGGNLEGRKGPCRGKSGEKGLAALLLSCLRLGGAIRIKLTLAVSRRDSGMGHTRRE